MKEKAEVTQIQSLLEIPAQIVCCIGTLTTMKQFQDKPKRSKSLHDF